MFTLLKNADCYCPKPCGKNDILICGDKISGLKPQIQELGSQTVDVIDCEGLFAFPGLVDQHVHILGGGGEEGFSSRIPEIDVHDVFQAGVTTLVGLLGADSCTRSLTALYAKAKALDDNGVTTFLYSGSYFVPSVTFTQSIVYDLAFIDRVIGVKIALSDHRSSHPELAELIKIASDVHLGGLIGGKAGVLHIHFGDGKKGLTPLFEMVEHSDLPIDMFVPTHVNRNPALFRQAMEYCRSGGHIDLTAGETDGLSVPDAVSRLASEGIDFSRVTVSSDASGSIPSGGVSKIQSLYEDITLCITREGIKPETAFCLVTENVARVLKLYPKKGTLREGGDADILLTDKNFYVKKVISRGNIVVDQ